MSIAPLTATTEPQTPGVRHGLFAASCIGLVATAMCFGIRAEIMTSLSREFHLTNQRVGWIVGAAFWGFTLSMLIGGQLCDWLGMRRLILFAFACHVVGLSLTIAASGFSSLYVGTLVIGVANGFYEAATNTLVVTLFPQSKVARLNRMHVWFPLGIVIGALVAFLFNLAGGGWRAKTATILIPTLAYGWLFHRQTLPSTERAQHRVPAGAVYRQLLRPRFFVLLLCIVLTASAELGPNQWMPALLESRTTLPGILVLAWISGLMALGRYFAGALVKYISPTALLIFSTLLAASGLFGLGFTDSGAGIVVSATVYALGICYCWPTMYGIAADKFPDAGALVIALIGGVGMLSDAFVVPIIGSIYDQYGARVVFRIVAALPATVAGIFLWMWIRESAVRNQLRAPDSDSPSGELNQLTNG